MKVFKLITSDIIGDLGVIMKEKAFLKYSVNIWLN
jgi:hypothetical protein